MSGGPAELVMGLLIHIFLSTNSHLRNVVTTGLGFYASRAAASGRAAQSTRRSVHGPNYPGDYECAANRMTNADDDRGTDAG
jgi:hypothetical protein